MKSARLAFDTSSSKASVIKKDYDKPCKEITNILEEEKQQ